MGQSHSNLQDFRPIFEVLSRFESSSDHTPFQHVSCGKIFRVTLAMMTKGGGRQYSDSSLRTRLTVQILPATSPEKILRGTALRAAHPPGNPHGRRQRDRLIGDVTRRLLTMPPRHPVQRAGKPAGQSFNALGDVHTVFASILINAMTFSGASIGLTCPPSTIHVSILRGVGT